MNNYYLHKRKQDIDNLSTKEFVFVGGPLNGHRKVTGGMNCYRFMYMPYERMRVMMCDANSIQYTGDIAEDCIYYLEDVMGTLWYRYEKDTINDSFRKLVDNYKPRKKKW